ncbi:MAG: hypothetical protein KGH77_03250 [Candidatus Micrarchaeota archaeon]|nr:hypothetical protein [Candidatus Micrarchaeota archaeon]MDE1864417.1 hypothetical protein [Candidatus Micrarchaeota archaeon]
MSLHEIKERILKEAQLSADSTSEEGKNESSRILSEARERSKRIRDEAAKELALKIELMRREHGAGVEIERNNAMLLAREQVIDANLGSVRRAISTSIIRKGYDKVLRKALAAAKEISNGNDLFIVANKSLKPALEKMGYSVQLSSIEGVVIQSRNGSIKMDASVDTLLNNNMEMIKSAIAREVFGGKVPKPAKQERKKPRAAKPKRAKKATGKKKRGK